PTVTPTVTTTYTVTGSNGVCTHDTTITVKVLPPPVITVNGGSICIGKDTTLTATGGGKYVWSTGATSSSILVSPSSNKTYTVVVTAPDGCVDSATTSVSVDVPTMAVCCDTAIERGTSVKLTASGSVVAYVWTPGSGLSCFTCPNPSANPSVNTTYTVTGTDANG